MKNKVITVLCIIYVILAIFVTSFLLTRNEFRVFELNDSYYIYNPAITEFNKTSLVHFERKEDYGYLAGEEVYYFDNDKILKKETMISFSKEDKKFSVQGGEYEISHLLGKPDRGLFLIGSILGFLTTKFVYLVFIIIPVFILLIYEVYLLFIYLKKGKHGKDLENEKDKE